MSSDDPTVPSDVGVVRAIAFQFDSVVLSPETYRRLAEESGFRQENLEKVVRLGQLLSAVQKDPALTGKLALKGGTALNLLGESVRRLSVDLDFNYVGEVEKESMLRDKPAVLAAMRKVGEALGYASGVPRDAHGGSTFAYRYRNSLGTQDQIEVDLNWITRVPLGPVQTRTLWQPAGVQRPLAVLVSTEELVVGKLRALTERLAARDIFDAGFLPELIQGDWPPAMVKALFVFYSGTLDRPLWTYDVNHLDRLTEREFEKKLMPVLRPDSVTSRPEMIERAKAVLRPLLKLGANEVEYIERLQIGDFRPELILPFDLGLADRLSHHPALLWKAQNARERAEKQKRR